MSPDNFIKACPEAHDIATLSLVCWAVIYDSVCSWAIGLVRVLDIIQTRKWLIDLVTSHPVVFWVLLHFWYITGGISLQAKKTMSRVWKLVPSKGMSNCQLKNILMFVRFWTRFRQAYIIYWSQLPYRCRETIRYLFLLSLYYMLMLTVCVKSENLYVQFLSNSKW